ncbi:MAG TPA: dihydrodipicolinate synthase family protein [Candidatus Acidoferrales bacterium]|nr:dihydrodipicolinate synthase family protein [Candidatus Acidoferrales bacterium]
MKLRGIFPPVTTPFSADGEVDLERLRENIRKYNQTRISGYVMNGSTSESVLLDWDEIERLWAAAREAAAPEKVMIAGTGAEATAETIRHTKRAAALGYQAALVRTPSYYKPAMSFEAETAHFFRVADASPIPVLIYSVPVFTGYTVEAPLAAKLATHPNIVGIKDSSGNVQRMKDIVAAAPKGFNALGGSGLMLAESIEAGAVGGILAISCIAPDACADLYEAARRGEKAEIEALKKQFTNPAASLVAKFGIAGIKFAMDRLGYYGGATRAPLLPIADAAKPEIEALVTAIRPPVVANT